MTGIEKRFVNRRKKSERNILKLESDFKLLDFTNIKTVLELGCGIGFVSSYLVETYNFKVYGTDYDPEQIQIARNIQPKLKPLYFQVEEATKLSFEDSSIDLVLLQNLFHHVPKWKDGIKEITRVFRSGGYLIWLDLTFPGIIKNVFLPFVKNYGLYTIDDIKTAFEIHGFKKLFQEQLSHGLLKQHHFVLQRN